MKHSLFALLVAGSLGAWGQANPQTPANPNLVFQPGVSSLPMPQTPPSAVPDPRPSAEAQRDQAEAARAEAETERIQLENAALKAKLQAEGIIPPDPPPPAPRPRKIKAKKSKHSSETNEVHQVEERPMAH